MTTSALKVGLLGYGVVGSAVARLLTEQAEVLRARVGAPLELVGVAVRRASVPRPGPVLPQLFTADPRSLVERGDLDVVVEVMGGLEPARSLILSALEHGASVVTANKALLAEDGATVFAAAEKAGRDVYFEAAVGGAIPILRPLRESLAGDRVTRVVGIVNGTTNFILDRMDTAGADFGAALAQAQSLGFAESDASADVDGRDAAAKAAILASLAFHTRVTTADVHCEGIRAVSAGDIAWAKSTGRVVKLLAICQLGGRPGAPTVSVRVHPAMIPRVHPLASVHEAYNAVLVESEAAGRLMFYGPGAGGAPTASAVLGDVVAAARNRVQDLRGVGESTYAQCELQPMGETPTRYYIAVDVVDRVGVLAAVASRFAAAGVSLQTVHQEGRGDEAQLVLVTHAAVDSALSATVAELRAMDEVRRVVSVLRVEEDAEP